MGARPEARLLHECYDMLETLRGRGWQLWWTKITGGPHQETGLPDLLICCYGQFVAPELKRSDGGRVVVRPKQVWHLGKIRDAGGIGEVVASAAELFDLLAVARAQAGVATLS